MCLSPLQTDSLFLFSSRFSSFLFLQVDAGKKMKEDSDSIQFEVPSKLGDSLFFWEYEFLKKAAQRGSSSSSEDGPTLFLLCGGIHPPLRNFICLYIDSVVRESPLSQACCCSSGGCTPPSSLLRCCCSRRRPHFLPPPPPCLKKSKVAGMSSQTLLKSP